MTYYEVYDNVPFIDDRYNENSKYTLIGRWEDIESAKRQMKQYTESIGINDYKDHLYTIPDIYDEEKKTICICGLFYDMNDKEVSFSGEWAYGRYVSIVKVELRMGVFI